MFKKTLFTFAVLYLSTICIYAQNIQPQPKKVQNLGGSISLLTGYTIKGAKSDTDAVHLLRKMLPEWPRRKSTRIIIGEKGDNYLKKHVQNIPNIPGGYYLGVEDRQIILAGYDKAGIFYGAQTLVQLLKENNIPKIKITDYPDIMQRGIIERFTDDSWNHEQRIAMIRYLGKNKLNSYVYAPENDPYANAPAWDKPYPEEELALFKELLEESARNKVSLTWSVSLSHHYKWDEEDFLVLKDKLESMYATGFRSFAIFLNEFNETPEAARQIKLFRNLFHDYSKSKEGLAPLLIYPTLSNKRADKNNYLDSLGMMLPPFTEVFWTGDQLVSDITTETVDFAKDKLKRDPFILWNYPVNDYTGDHLLLGPCTGLSAEISNKTSGFIINPMRYPEASKLSIYSIANYTWNTAGYKANEVWEKAVKDLMPVSNEHLRFFALHNANPGRNRFNFHREESAAIKPVIEKFLSSYSTGKYDDKDYEAIINEYKKMSETTSKMLTSTDNDKLVEELRPWLIRFDLLGQAGIRTMELIKIYEKDKGVSFWNKFCDLKNIENENRKVNQLYNQSTSEMFLKTASTLMTPFVEQLADSIGKSFYYYLSEKNYYPQQKSHFTKEPTVMSERRRVNAILSYEEDKISITPFSEEFQLDSGQYIGILLPLITDLEKIELLYNSSLLSSTRVELTTEFEKWEPVHLSGNPDSLLYASLTKKPLRAIRIINTTDSTLTLNLKKFSITSNKPILPEYNWSLAIDGDFETAYVLRGREEINISNTELWNNFSETMKREPRLYGIGKALPPINKVTLLTSPNVNTNITLTLVLKNGKKVRAGTFTSSISSVFLNKHSNIQSIELKNNSGTAAHIYEMIWQEK